MHMAAAILATGLVALLVCVQPFAGRARYQRLVASLPTDPGARLRHYRRGIIGQWVAVALVGLIGLLSHRSLSSIGLRGGPHAGSAAATVAEVAVILGLSAALFRFGGPNVRQVLRRQAKGFLAVLPRTRREKMLFAGLALTAGICEEILFRGFGIAYVRWLWPTASRSALIVVTAAGFGFAHLYQRTRGIVLAGLLGGYFAWVTLSTGSLLPAMAMHALVDLRILALPDLDQPDLDQVAP
jgi:membrane protease YdiL (CAAX protease family)